MGLVLVLVLVQAVIVRCTLSIVVPIGSSRIHHGVWLWFGHKEDQLGHMTPLLILEVEQVDLHTKLVSMIEDICLSLISVSSSRLEHRAPEVTAHFAVECVLDAISQHSDQAGNHSAPVLVVSPSIAAYIFPSRIQIYTLNNSLPHFNSLRTLSSPVERVTQRNPRPKSKINLDQFTYGR